MSEHITHLAVYEDCARLALHSKKINNAFKSSLKEFPDIGLLASASRGNHLFAVPIIERAKKLSAADLNAKENKMKMAAAVGWITHRAADLQTKPLVKQIDYEKETQYDKSVNEIYQDAVTWDKVYEGGKRKSLSEDVWLSPAVMEPGMRSHPGAVGINVDETELLFAVLVQRSLLEQHNFMNQEKDFGKWMETLLERRQNFHEDYQVYIEAYQNPKPELMKKFIYDTNFYNEKDDLIRLARSLQLGKADTSINLDEAFRKAETQSHYAQAVRKGMHSLFTATDYFENRVDKETLYEAMGMDAQFRF